MNPAPPDNMRVLEIRRTYAASREKAFAAWTQIEALKKWWGVSEGYTVSIAEVDLRIGGRYRLGMSPPNSETVIVLTGEYLVIQPPEKLVFTWGFESEEGNVESLITLRFLARDDQTEIVLTHEYQGPEEMAENFRAGWEGMFIRLEHALTRMEI